MLDMAPGTSTMLRARRKDINVKPNRRLDRKSSRGMLYENEELRLRTININAEVEKGQSDIKKLRRENEHLRREIWGLRDEYDRLEGLLKKRRGQDSENEEEEYDREDDEEDEDDEEEDADEEEEDRRDQENEENAQKATTATSGSSSILGGHRDTSRRNSLRVEFDGLSVVDEEADETQTVSEQSPGYQQETDQDGGPYCGTITLPNGRQGVFFSDAMAAPRRKVNGAGPNISFSEYQSLLASHNVDPGDMQFPPEDPPDGYTYPYYENTGAIGLGALVSTAPSPPPDDSDYFHSIARAGPDLFITGAYPVSKSPAEAMFPTGGNLDQLLREVHSQELAAEQDAEGDDPETRVVVEPDHVCAGQLTLEDLRQSVPPRVKHELTDRETEEQRRLLRSEQVENCGPRHLAVRDGLLSVDATPTTVPPGHDATPLVGGESAVQETLRSVCEALPGVGNGDELIGDDGEGERYGNNASGGQCHEATVLAAREVEPADDEATVVTTDYSPEFFALRSPGGSVAVFRQTQSVVASLRRGSDRVTTRTTHTTTTTSTTVQKREWVRGPAQSRCGKQRDYVRLNGIRPHTLVLYTDWSDLTVKEVIDALETQLGDAGLRGGVRGVRAQSGECYICLSRQQEAQSLLRSGLGLRGHHLTLLDVSRDSLVVCLSGVPHHVTDTAVALLAASFGTVIGEVERRLYKGVDTGERLLRVKPNPGVDQLPPAVSLAGSKVKLRVLPPEEVAALGHAGDLPLTTSPEPPTSSTQYGDDQRACSSSSDNSLNGDSRFKSHLNVRLKQPDTASTPNILPNTASLAPSQPPFFSTLPSTRKGPQWPTMDAEHQQVPRNPFSADYQATLPSNARLSSSDSSALAGNANPFTYPAHPNFDSEYVLPSPGPNPSGGRIPHQTISGHVPPPVIAPGTPLTHRPTPAPSYLNPNAVLISPTHKNLTAEKQLDALSPQSNSTPSSPINSRQQRLSKKAGGPPHARSFDETMPCSASPLLGRRVNISSPITIHKKERMSRKTSGNSVSSQPSADDGEALPPSLAASTPTSQKKNSRKISVNVSEVHPQSNADASRCSSSSGQDSPTKSDRRRRVSVYFNKKGGGRRDSNVVGNGTRSLSASRYGPGEGGEATTSDRERTNSVSSRTSSATGGGRRKLSKSSNRALDVGDNKVPWCGCWGNGCI